MRHMIRYLSGILFFREEQSVIVLVSGVGYHVRILERAPGQYAIGDSVSLYVSSYSRDGMPELYGFNEHDDIILFERLISVSGVGPKSAIAILRLAPASDIRDAICQGNGEMLKKISGIGRKTAERIIVELKNEFSMSPYGEKRKTDGIDDIVFALVRLGYSRQDAQSAAREIPSSADTPEEKLKYCLKMLSL